VARPPHRGEELLAPSQGAPGRRHRAVKSLASTSEGDLTLPTGVPPPRIVLALFASGQEWSSRALETVLKPGGYAVIRAYSGRETVERARRSHPDIILLDAHLPDRDGLELCRTLREDPHVG